MYTHTHVLTHAQRCVHIHICVIAHMPKEVCTLYIRVLAHVHTEVCAYTHTCTWRPRKLQGGNRRKVRRTCSQENTERGDIS